MESRLPQEQRAERGFAVDGWGASDRGLIRKNNEDTWFLDPSLELALVADGMGGAACGEVASAIAAETVVGFFREHRDRAEIEATLREAITGANQRVLERAGRDPACRGMGSTIVVARWSLPDVVIANVGDSRAYLWRAGKLVQLSYDQTVINELCSRFSLTPEQARTLPHAHVLTMAVGATPNLLVRTRHERVIQGDVLLLCSDGLSGVVSESAISRILGSAEPVKRQVQALISEALAAGAPDNVTAVVVRFQTARE